EAHAAADDASVHDAGGGCGIHHAPAHAASALLASTASEKGVRAPLRSWYVSWPLPAISTTSPGRAAETASRIATRRSFSIAQRRWPASRMPLTTALAITDGSSLRGLSLVTTMRSARAAAI